MRTFGDPLPLLQVIIGLVTDRLKIELQVSEFNHCVDLERHFGWLIFVAKWWKGYTLVWVWFAFELERLQWFETFYISRRLKTRVCQLCSCINPSSGFHIKSELVIGANTLEKYLFIFPDVNSMVSQYVDKCVVRNQLYIMLYFHTLFRSNLNVVQQIIYVIW